VYELVRVRACLKGKRGENPPLSRNCDSESFMISHWETGKA